MTCLRSDMQCVDGDSFTYSAFSPWFFTRYESEGAFSGQRRMEDSKRTSWQCTVAPCVAGVHCWEVSLGLAYPWNVIFCLSCRFILGFSCVYSFCTVSDCVFCVIFYYMFMCVSCFCLVVSSCQVIGQKKKSFDDTVQWLGDIPPQSQVEEIVCIFFLFVYVAMCYPRPYTIYISYTYGTIQPVCAESAVKHHQSKPIHDVDVKDDVVSEVCSVWEQIAFLCYFSKMYYLLNIRTCRQHNRALATSTITWVRCFGPL